ncbi:hypothetical protein MauCBS54593_005325 [Microsporum audouinii]
MCNIRALVLYDRQIARMTDTPGTLRVGGQELAPYVHNDLGRAVLSLPGLHVRYVPYSIDARQILSHRASYINGLLIQSRGRPEVHACTDWPFTECVRLPSHFGGARGNCTWRDRASHCSVRDEIQQARTKVIVLDDDSGDDRQVIDLTGDGPVRRPRARITRGGDGSSASRAIVLL